MAAGATGHVEGAGVVVWYAISGRESDSDHHSEKECAEGEAQLAWLPLGATAAEQDFLIPQVRHFLLLDQLVTEHWMHFHEAHW